MSDYRSGVSSKAYIPSAGQRVPYKLKFRLADGGVTERDFENPAKALGAYFAVERDPRAVIGGLKKGDEVLHAFDRRDNHRNKDGGERRLSERQKEPEDRRTLADVYLKFK